MSKADTDNDFKIVGLFKVPNLPKELHESGKDATTTPGGFTNDIRGNFKALESGGDFDSNKVELFLTGETSLLDAYAGVSHHVILAERFHKPITKALGDLLRAEKNTPEQVAKRVAMQEDGMVARWGTFEKTPQGKAFLRGRDEFRSTFVDAAAGGGGRAAAPAGGGKKAATRKSQSSRGKAKRADADLGKESSESDGDEPEVQFGREDDDEDQDLSSKRGPAEDFSRSLSVLTNGDTIGMVLLRLRPNMTLVKAAETTENQLYAHFQHLAKSNSAIQVAVNKVTEMTPVDYSEHPIVTYLEKFFGYKCKARILIIFILQSFAITASAPKRAQAAMKAFFNWGNTAKEGDVPALKVKFEDAMRRLVSEGGEKPSDTTGALSEAFLSSMRQSKIKLWRDVAENMQATEERRQGDIARQRAAAAAASGGGLPTPTDAEPPATLDLTMNYVMIEYKAMLKRLSKEDKRENPPQPKSKPKPKVAAAEEHETDDGPAHVAHGACHMCKKNHHMNDVDENGERYHSNTEIHKFKRASAQGAQTAQAQVGNSTAHHAGAKGKGKGNGSIKDKGHGKGKGHDQGNSHGKGIGMYVHVNNQVDGHGHGGKGAAHYQHGKGGRGHGYAGGAAYQEEYWDDEALEDLAVAEAEAELLRVRARQAVRERMAQRHGGRE